MASIVVKYDIQVEVRFDTKWDDITGEDLRSWACDEETYAGWLEESVHDGNYVVPSVHVSYDKEEE